ncbi:MAG: N-acetylmuramoyl-L-alanine amidase [Pseudomonadota bacterium]
MEIIQNFLSPNYDSRPSGVKIDSIIIHYTEMIFEEAIEKLCNQGAKVSCHYLIHENGEIFQLVSDASRAWHAGESSWKGETMLNNSSLGIELDNLGDRKFSDKQMQSCVALCQKLIALYDIQAQNILGHSDIAPSRKIDPGIHFDWEFMAQNGLGIWYNSHGINKSEDMNDYTSIQERLKTFGYKIEVTGKWDLQTSDVIRAFQSHFCSESLRRKGLNFYQELNNEYFWNQESEDKLSSLLEKQIMLR